MKLDFERIRNIGGKNNSKQASKQVVVELLD